MNIPESPAMPLVYALETVNRLNEIKEQRMNGRHHFKIEFSSREVARSLGSYHNELVERKDVKLTDDVREDLITEFMRKFDNLWEYLLKQQGQEGSKEPREPEEGEEGFGGLSAPDNVGDNENYEGSGP